MIDAIDFDRLPTITTELHRVPALTQVHTAGLASDEYLNESLSAIRRSLEQTVTFSAESALSGALEKIKRHCSAANWDGEGAEPISTAALDATLHFTRKLPDRIVDPEVGSDAAGGVSLDWIFADRERVSLLIFSDRIVFASISGAQKVFGETPFIGEVPDVVLRLLDREA